MERGRRQAVIPINLQTNRWTCRQTDAISNKLRLSSSSLKMYAIWANLIGKGRGIGGSEVKQEQARGKETGRNMGRREREQEKRGGERKGGKEKQKRRGKKEKNGKGEEGNKRGW